MDYDLMARELDRLLKDYLGGIRKRETSAALRDFLWDHKVGILRALQTAASKPGVMRMIREFDL